MVLDEIFARNPDIKRIPIPVGISGYGVVVRVRVVVGVWER